jgi:hypothetical protein
MNFKNILKSLTIVALLAGVSYAGDASLQTQKDEIWEMAKLYKLDNQKRSVRLPSAPKANIGKPIYRVQKGNKSTADAQVTQDNKPRVYNFETTTAWGTYKVEAIEYPGQPYFDVTFQSPHPAQGLVIRDTTRKMDIDTKNLPDVYSPDAPLRINYAYQPIYLMILKVSVNGEIQPQIIPLYKKANVKTAE